MYKIAVVGPESTGKSALTQFLATYYSSPKVDEYARSYVEQLNRPYTFDDVCRIALHQIDTENQFAGIAETANEPFVFFDTELIITRVWMEYCYGEVPSFVDEQLKKGFFDLYLLCNTDLPWEPDPVREHGHDRDYFFNWYRREIEQLQKPYVVIQGFGKERNDRAIQALENHFFLTNDAS